MQESELLEQILPTALYGSVVRPVGMTAAAADFPAPVGALAEIDCQAGPPLLAEVIGFRDHLTLLYPLSRLSGVRRGNRVRLVRTARWLRVGRDLLGRVINAHGETIDGKPQPLLPDRVPFDRKPPEPCSRPRIDTPLPTGIRAIDAMLTCGRGQRLGIFSGPGVGKSILLGMMARFTQADVIVIALIGERGREVNEFIERDLGPQGLAKSVVVVATSNEPAVVRVQAASTATSVAEYFRDQGADVLLLMDSITRFAMAQREIGLAAGEPPTTRGYTPSVFALLPRLVERTGRAPEGSITAFYSVLVEADDLTEPVADAMRGLLDGHIWLSRNLASRGHYPAVDVLESLSRLMPEVVSPQHLQAAQTIRELLAAYRDQEDLILIGAYRRGSNPTVDTAMELREDIHRLLRQGMEERSVFEEAQKGLLDLATRAEQMRQSKKNAAGVGSGAASASASRPAPPRPTAPPPS
jgi:flagellum-specific ATP synthase